MTSLNNQQKQLLFDYSLGLTSQGEDEEAQRLVASNAEAVEIHSKIRAALAPLDALEPEKCPDQLLETTISRVNNLAKAGQLRLHQLLAQEQARSAATKTYFWRNFGQIAAAAAVILIAVAAWFAPISHARQKYWQHRCQKQLAQVFQGLSSYIADHDGQMPAVARTAGAPWWKVGYQGKENHSATRSMWLPVKNGYVQPANFVCPGRRQTAVVRIDPAQVKQYNDFPGRKYINYSIRICRSKSSEPQLRIRKVIMSDLSPLFESVPDDYSEPLSLRLSRDMLTLNSSNHERRGQNVLFCDGSVKFIKTRYVDVSQDDIFTLREMSPDCEVRGCETPSCETDIFAAP